MDDINTNAEYVSEKELNNIEGVDGEELDTAEKDQTEKDILEEGAKHELRKGIEGNDDNAQDGPLDEENA